MKKSLIIVVLAVGLGTAGTAFARPHKKKGKKIVVVNAPARIVKTRPVVYTPRPDMRWHKRQRLFRKALVNKSMTKLRVERKCHRFATYMHPRKARKKCFRTARRAINKFNSRFGRVMLLTMADFNLLRPVHRRAVYESPRAPRHTPVVYAPPQVRPAPRY